MKKVKSFEDYINENKSYELEKVIDILNTEMSWNKPSRISKIEDNELDMYDYVKKLTTTNGIIYWGMAGQSLIPDFKRIFQKHSINATVNRGHETSRSSDEHDYIIVLS